MNPEQRRQLRLHRTLLLGAGAAYLCWWLFVRAALPDAFNPLGSRLAVVACFFALYGLSFRSSALARNLDAWLAVCCALGTAHYFYLLDRNRGDLNWVVGAYITVGVVCATLQTSRALVGYSLVVVGLAAWLLVRQTGVSYVVFLPGLLTNLLFANIGLSGRLRLLAHLRESHGRIESLFDAGFEGIAVHERGVIRQVNGQLAALLGRSKRELAGEDLMKLFAPESRAAAREMVEQRREASYVADVLRADGTRVPVEVIAKRHVQGGRDLQQVAFRDMTERRRAEAALLRANQDLESFSYSVAHDLRGPLRTICGYSQILIEDHADRLDAEGKAHLERIVGGAKAMAGLIDALLGLTRMTRTEVKRGAVDLTKLGEAIVERLRADHPGRAVEFVAEPGLTAQGDADLLRAMLENLIGNAWKFTEHKANARVVFARTERDGEPVFYVRDNGAGFDMAHAKKLFSPFQRLHTTAEFPGTGIGLATVKRIVERHGGRVWAEGSVGQGATVYFTLAPR